jgi:TrpR-related protein YerC/YecD
MAKDLEKLLRAILSLRSPPEAWRFFRDLMTDDELAMIARRWRVVSMLSEGASYRQITEQTGMSSRTVARIARWFREGPGGYRLALTRRSLAATRSRGSAVAGGARS